MAGTSNWGMAEKWIEKTKYKHTRLPGICMNTKKSTRLSLTAIAGTFPQVIHQVNAECYSKKNQKLDFHL